jgi:tetratricopeptide (TPR) repeat protein
MKKILASAVFCTAIAFASTANAESSAELKLEMQCLDETGSSSMMLNACTALIDSKATAPDDRAIAFVYRGIYYSRHDKYEIAIENYNQAIAIRTGATLAFYNRAGAYLMLNQFEKAIEDYDMVEALNSASGYAPDIAHYAYAAFYHRGVARTQLGQYARAVQDYGEAIKLKPDDAVPLYGRCDARGRWGQQLQSALEDCNRAIQLSPKEAYMFDARGLVNFRLGQFDNAIADYSTALDKDPEMASSLYMRGIAKIRLGDSAGGNADMSAAKEMESSIGAQLASIGVTP